MTATHMMDIVWTVLAVHGAIFLGLLVLLVCMFMDLAGEQNQQGE